jgi:hypothetical protein
MFDVKRREVIMMLGGAAAAWPLTARAQQRPAPVIAILGSGGADSGPSIALMRALDAGMRELGLVEGRGLRARDPMGRQRLEPLSRACRHAGFFILSQSGERPER